ncbi:hypothetical protein [Magnetospira sp. QH-2]|uniref:hypothetical protein n=1 Tax=Magnetospira sp. (strain QH-2) TaxID=1288970 RepID=UPI0003E80FE6|nr:hypothetical protein [Magnetospira sp. QH-2]CCQ75283.1 conserved exported protein of unknown function [Magnetospira sp. QH-2]
MTRKLLLTSAIALGLLASTATAWADTLETLERERAVTVDLMLDPELTVPDRMGKLATAQRRLVDLERMVLRDDSLRGKNTRAVRQAFKNYDITFLAHGSVEKNRAMIDNWLDQFGVSTESLMAAKVGRR